MIVATNQDPKHAIYSDLRRWEIETLFGSLKSKGFRFEDTHMTQQVRIEKLMALLVMGFVWAHKVGEWRAESTPIQWKVFRDGRRPQYAYFRYGLDFIRDIVVLNLSQKYRQFKQIIQQLIPYQSTKKTPLC